MSPAPAPRTNRLFLAGVAGTVLLIAWATMAIYYSNLPWPGLRLALGAAFAGS